MAAVRVKIEGQKRARAANLEANEKSLLLELIKEYQSVIEDKKTTTNTNKAKANAWAEMHKRFSDLNGRDKSVAELKQQWRTLKLEAKKEISTHRRAQSETGGGPKPPSPSPESLLVRDMVPMEFEEDFNPYDSNAQMVIGDGAVASTSAEEVEILIVRESPEDTFEPELQTFVVEPEQGETTQKPQEADKPDPTSEVPKKKQKKKIDDTKQISLMAEERMAIFRKNQDEEQKIKIKNMEEEHRVKMLVLQTQLKHSVEEHKLQMQYLKAKLDKELKE